VRDAKRKSPPDIADAGRPSKEPNQIATRGVPNVYPDAMKAVCERERAHRDVSFVPRILTDMRRTSLPKVSIPL
jgi:hypothetical protein